MQRAQHFMARARCDDGNQPRSCSSGPDQQNGRQTPFKTDPKTKGQRCRKILSLSSWCEILEAAALSLLPGNFRITSCEFVQVLRCKSSNLEKQMLLRNFAHFSSQARERADSSGIPIHLAAEPLWPNVFRCLQDGSLHVALRGEPSEGSCR